MKPKVQIQPVKLVGAVIQFATLHNAEFVIKKEAFTGDGILFNSEFLNRLTVNQAIEKIIKVTTQRKLGKKKNYVSP